MAASPPIPLADRSCEGCTLCCKLPRVEALNKPRDVMCANCVPGQGCQIYEARPGECRDFFCYYRLSADLGEEWNPLTSHMIVMVQGKGRRVHVLVDEGYYDIWRTEPYHAQIKAMAANALQQGAQLIVWEGAKTIGVLPDGDFPLTGFRPEHIFAAAKRAARGGDSEL